MSSIAKLPAPWNEPALSYAPGSAERAELKQALSEMSGEQPDIPLIIGGQEVRTRESGESRMPHAHAHVLATWHKAGVGEVEQAIAAAREAQEEWANWSWEERAAVFLRAAELLAGPWRQRLNAATMLGQSKTAHQAEIDSACEMIDFLRFNVHFASEIHQMQPASATHGVWNRLDYRPLEGFVYAISPFNFTAIAGNLSTAPALMGNVVIWKPSDKAMLSGYYLMRLFEEAGLPPGVINFLPGEPALLTRALLDSPDFAGLHFTGSTSVFQNLWQEVGSRLPHYHGYPRLVGETGGKDFIVAHPSAEPAEVATAIIRGGFEYQGQKCSAASRVYIPDSLWPKVKEALLESHSTLRVGDVRDFSNFMGAVIDRRSFQKIARYLEHARSSAGVEILAGGGTDDSVGYFVQPTLVKVEDPGYQLMCEEVFGPVVAIHVYPEARWQATLEVVNRTSPYALTGAVFARSRRAVQEAYRVLRHAAGNFYINDKPTGAMVGEQPFGGARSSGTNDKAGSPLNLLRWVSPRTIKETFVPARDYRYPYLAEE